MEDQILLCVGVGQIIQGLGAKKIQKKVDCVVLNDINNP
jgi:hypothetical protein